MIANHLETLWAPWRVEYFENTQQAEKDFLLEAAHTHDDEAHLVVARRKNAFLIMNKYPYATGHLMAVPYQKRADISELSEAEVLDLWHITVHAQNLLRTVVRAQGFNIGFNLGTVAGAGISEHIHLHIVPRWSDDQNFMPLLAGTRIIPEGLRPLYERLMQAQKTTPASA